METTRKIAIKWGTVGATLVMAGVFLQGCESMQSHSLARTTGRIDHVVKVSFDADGCPVDVSPPVTSCVGGGSGFCVGRAESIKWVSEPQGNAFEVYFDPFVGRPYASHGQNEETSPVIVRRDTLLGEYKYGVFGVNCLGAKPVLDPPLRVDH